MYILHNCMYNLHQFAANECSLRFWTSLRCPFDLRSKPPQFRSALWMCWHWIVKVWKPSSLLCALCFALLCCLLCRVCVSIQQIQQIQHVGCGSMRLHVCTWMGYAYSMRIMGSTDRSVRCAGHDCAILKGLMDACKKRREWWAHVSMRSLLAWHGLTGVWRCLKMFKVYNLQERFNLLSVSSQVCIILQKSPRNQGGSFASALP